MVFFTMMHGGGAVSLGGKLVEFSGSYVRIAGHSVYLAFHCNRIQENRSMTGMERSIRLGRSHGLGLITGNGRLRRRQSGDRHTVRRAGHVLHSRPVTEHNRAGLAAMLAADADF